MQHHDGKKARDASLAFFLEATFGEKLFVKIQLKLRKDQKFFKSVFLATNFVWLIFKTWPFFVALPTLQKRCCSLFSHGKRRRGYFLLLFHFPLLSLSLTLCAAALDPP